MNATVPECLLFYYFAFELLKSVFKHVYIYTYTRHTHKYKVNMYELYNGA